MSLNPHNQIALITGGTGYIGNRLAQYLAQAGWQVSLLVGRESDLTKLPDTLKSKVLKSDGSPARIQEIVRQTKPDVVFHLAAYTVVEHASEDIARLIESNISLGVNLLEAMRTHCPSCFINTGSFWQHFEGEAYNPVNLYAATKQAFQDLMRYYTQTTPIRAMTLKLFDVYGEDDPRRKLFVQLDQARLTGKAVSVSPGDQKLDLVYIEDVVRAYVVAAELLAGQKAAGVESDFAVTSGELMTLRKVVELYEEIYRCKLPLKWGARSYRAREVMRPWRGERLPRWKANISLAEGLGRLYTAHKKDVVSHSG